MIILRQKEYSALGFLGGVGGYLAGATLGSKIPMKRKLKKGELKDEKEVIDEYKKVIKQAKSGFTKKDALEGNYWHSDDLLSKYGVGDNPDELDYKLLNKHREEIIKESEKRIKQHEDTLKNPDKHKKKSAIPSLIGGALGAVGGVMLGRKLNDKLKSGKNK